MKMLAYLRLIRPVTSLLAAAGTFAGSVVTVGAASPSFLIPISLAFLTVFLQNAASYALNDFIDLAADKKNHPERPLPSGKIKPKSALILSASLFLASLVVATFINQMCFAVSIATLAILLLYDVCLKRLPGVGNFAIAFLAGVAFIFGSLAVGSSATVYLLALLAFFATFGREITKDIADVKWDVTKRTLPQKFGTKAAAMISSVLYLAAVFLSPLPYLVHMLGLSYLLIILPADVLFVYSLLTQNKQVHQAVKTAKLAMFIVLLAFLTGVFL